MRALAVLLVLVLGLGACGGDRGRDAQGPVHRPGADAPSAGVGPGLSIADALESTAAGPLLVNGYVVVEASGAVRLCTELMAGRPPGCGGPALRVEDLDVTTLPGLSSGGSTRWTQQSVQLLGEVSGQTLRVARTARA